MSLRDDAIAIWKAGLNAVDSAQAVARVISSNGRGVTVAGHRIELDGPGRIEVVGAGKAGAGMAHGLERALLKHWPAERLSGWINVPSDCVRPLSCLHLHAARPAGINEPTLAAVEGTRVIVSRVSRLTPSDVCIVLLSGGASALLCDPVPGITLDDKVRVTRLLAASGASIQELNLVRSHLSQVKAGRLATACRAGRLITLIISDVIGDPLDVIGSGPTVLTSACPGAALQVLHRRSVLDHTPRSVIEHLERESQNQSAPTVPVGSLASGDPIPGTHYVIASNKIALAAAADAARRLGYEILSLGCDNTGDAAECGRELLAKLRSLRQQHPPRRICILSGGEPTVTLNSGKSVTPTGRGGRNQELILAAIDAHRDPADWHGIALLSGGTDGEDGPTDVAGAFADAALVAEIAARDVTTSDFLNRHDSWNFFNTVGGHLKTGPTHTNVMDLRVGLVGN